MVAQMGKTGKGLVIALILVMAISSLSLLMVKQANAQTLSAPSVPQFTVSLVGPSYVNPTTYQLDQSTGQILANIGFTNEYRYVEITIKNQPFTPYFDANLSQNIFFLYNIQLKNHNKNSWIDIYNPDINSLGGYPLQSTDSDYTNLSIPIEGQPGSSILAGTQTDIQVQAMIGYVSRNGSVQFAPWYFFGETSSWSSTQTVNIPANFPLNSTSPSPTPAVPEFPFMAIPLLLSLLSVAAALSSKKKRIPKNML